MDERGYISPMPTSERGGYQGPHEARLERIGAEVWLTYNRGDGRWAAYPPNAYLVARPPSMNLGPRPGVRGPDGNWTVEPDPCIVDFLTGYAGKPIVIATCDTTPPDELVNDADDDDRVAARFVSVERSTGVERGAVALTACADGKPGLAVDVDDALVLSSGLDATISAGGVAHVTGTQVKVNAESSGAAAARVGDDATSTIVTDPVFWAWVAGLATWAAGLPVPYTVPPPTALASVITKGSSTVTIGG